MKCIIAQIYRKCLIVGSPSKMNIIFCVLYKFDKVLLIRQKPSFGIVTMIPHDCTKVR